MPGPRRSLLLWLALGVVLCALAVVCAAPVYQALVDLGWLASEPGPGGDPFGRVLRRLLLLAIGTVVLLGLKPWRDVGFTQVGLAGPSSRPRLGLLAGSLALAAVLAVLAAHALAGWLRWSPDAPGALAARVGRALLAAAVVSVLEEWFFRGWLPVRLGAWLRPGRAVAVSVVLFASAHAFKASHLADPPSRDAAGALSALGTWLRTLFNPAAFGPSFLGLVLFGLVLTLVYRRTRTLWAPIGIHAACILALQSYGGLTERIETPRWAGTKALYDGVPGWAILALAALLLAARRAPAAQAPARGVSAEA